MATTPKVSVRAAARQVDDAGHLDLVLPVIGSVRLPERQQLGYYVAIGALGALGIIEWPVETGSRCGARLGLRSAPSGSPAVRGGAGRRLTRCGTLLALRCQTLW